MKKYLLALGVVAFCSCGEKEEEPIPNYVLDKEQFSDLICDFTLAESAANLNVKNLSYEKFDSVYRFNPLADRNIPREKFDTSLYFYSHHPAIFKEVYQLVLEKLSRFQSSRK